MNVYKYVLFLGLFFHMTFTFAQDLELLDVAKVEYQYELTKTAFSSDGSDRARDGQPRFNGPMEGRVITYKNFQYVTYYEQNGSVIVARRNLDRPNRWERVMVKGHRMTLHDRHRKLAIGISEGDGVIHLAFDHHNTPQFNYALSREGVANDPENAVWDDETFRLMYNLGLSEDVGQVTYPNFYKILDADDLIVYWRSGGSVGGEMNLAHYSSTEHKWSYIGQISSRDGTYLGKTDTRGPYHTGFHSDTTGVIHCAWLWREDAFDEQFSYGNHGLYYAYSSDGGFTWNNTYDELIADTKNGERISIDNIETVMEIPLGYEASNAQQYAAIDEKTGDFHYFSTHRVSLSNTSKVVHHYIRRVNGEWSVSATNINNGGGFCYFAENYAFVLQDNDIFYASRESEFSNWKKKTIDQSLRSGQAKWDASRLNEGVLTYVVQSNPAELGDPTPVNIYEIRIAEDPLPKPKIEILKTASDTVINFGYQNLHVKIGAEYPDNEIEKAALYIDNTLIRIDSVAPYEWGNPVGETANELLGLDLGMHTLKVIVTDSNDLKASKYIDVIVWDESLDPVIENFSPGDTTIGRDYQFSIDATLLDQTGIDFADLFINDKLVRRISKAPFQWGTGDYEDELRFKYGENKVRLQAVNNLGFFKDSVITVTLTAESLVFPGKFWNIPGKIDAVFFDIGGEGVSYHDSEPGWKGGLREDNPRYDFAGEEDVEIGIHNEIYNLAYIDKDEWLKYTIDSVQSGIYSIIIEGASESTGCRVVIRLDADSLGIINIPLTSDDSNFKLFDIEGVQIVEDRINSELQIEFIHTRHSSNLCNIRSVRFERTGDVEGNFAPRYRQDHYFTIYPNPVNEKIVINSEKVLRDVFIYTNQGQLIKCYKQSDYLNEIGVDFLLSGVYFLKLVDDCGQTGIFRILKL